MNTNISWITTGVQNFNSLNLDLPDKPEHNIRVRILKLKSSISTDCDVSLNLFFLIESGIYIIYKAGGPNLSG